MRERERESTLRGLHGCLQLCGKNNTKGHVQGCSTRSCPQRPVGAHNSSQVSHASGVQDTHEDT